MLNYVFSLFSSSTADTGSALPPLVNSVPESVKPYSFPEETNITYFQPLKEENTVSNHFSIAEVNNAPITTTTTYEKLNSIVTGSSNYVSDFSIQGVKEEEWMYQRQMSEQLQKDKSLQLVSKYCYPDYLLTNTEKNKVNNYLQKLNKCYGSNKSLDQTSFYLTAQNNVIEERFKIYYFAKKVNYSSKKHKSLSMECQLSVKLLIVDIKVGSFSKLLYDTKSLMGFANDFGYFHTSLLIGPWRFDWYNNSCVVIKEWNGKVEDLDSKQEVFALLDIGTIKGNIYDTNLMLEAISKVCCKWNGEVDYHQINYNCQTFVKEMLSAINLSVPNEGPKARFFNYLSYETKVKRIYNYSNTLKRLINLLNDRNSSPYCKDDSIEFKTRAQVNEFCFWLDSIHYFNQSNDNEDISCDFWLLKAYDRSFEMMKDKKEETLEKYFFSQDNTLENNSIRNMRYNFMNLNINLNDSERFRACLEKQ
ncbi:hypothetical protein ABK040_003227 [Willaertia magna]